MSEEIKNTRPFRERIKDKYRLIVRNDDTLEEKASYQLSILNLYILVSSILLITALLVTALIIFTPLKRSIPGYGDVDKNRKFLALESKVQELEQELKYNETYTESFRRMLTNDVETVEDVGNIENIVIDSFPANTRIREDEILRSEVERAEIFNKPALQNPQTRMNLNQIYFIPPLTGELSKEFHPEEGHFGVDIMAPKNTAVKSISDGFVIASDWTLETGNTIGIQHDNQIISFYKHNSALLKKVGDRVKAGEAVAIIGNTGTLSTGPHLHFEIWHQGKALDPKDYITFD